MINTNTPAHLKQLILNLTRRLQVLEEQRALYGLGTPPAIILEIEDTRAEIVARQAELAQAELPQTEQPAPPAAWELESPKKAVPSVPFDSEPTHLFICYKRHAGPDRQLAAYLHDFLNRQGHSTFIDLKLQPGQPWLEEVDRRIKASDFFIALLSEESATSEMVQAEVRRAYEYRKTQGRPVFLPVRLAYEGLLPYSIDALLDPLQYILWRDPADNERVAADILAAISGQLPPQSPLCLEPVGRQSVISEDGSLILDEQTVPPPLPACDPRFLEELEAPGGTVKLRDRFYITREADAHFKRQVVRRGTITTIRASRQQGKSSLLVRGVNHARQHGASVVSLDLQRVDSEVLADPALFLHYLAEFIARKLRLDLSIVDKAWQRIHGPQEKLTFLLEDYILPASDSPIILAIDEADSLLQTDFYNDFFGMLRAWYNNAAYDDLWEKLNLVLVISTEPYLLISDVTQSPFNAGLKLYLEDFNESQVRELNWRHGSPVSPADFPGLMRLLNGHPYLTRKALYTLVTEQLTWADLTRVAADDDGPFGDHLRRQYWLLREEPELRTALKQIALEHRCVDEAALFRLSRAGLVRRDGEACFCRCDLYRLYFEDKL